MALRQLVRLGLAALRRGSWRLLRRPGVRYAEAPDIDRVVFICGLHRSGTTLVERHLVARSEVACLRARVPESEGQHLQDVYSPALAFGGPGRFAFDPRLGAEMERLGTSPELGRALLAAWSRFVSGEARVLIEKSPPNLLRIGWLRAILPGARFVIVARDPRAVSAATRKWSATTLAELMRHWDAAYGRAMEDFDPADCLKVRYEDFCADPEAELSRIAEFADLAPRAVEAAAGARFETFRNSNDAYIARHGGRRYGAGAWEAFGYEGV